MRQRSIAYWTTTVFVSCVIGVSGSLAITHAGPMMKALSHLGYPVTSRTSWESANLRVFSCYWPPGYRG